ncbi:MAG: thiamine-phosphate kinase, partial [Candidatus Hydrothermarchaeales archaeon]
MKLSDLGERKVVDILTKKYGKDKGKNVIVGIGDDACVLDLNEKEHLVISTDIVFEKTHIPREMTPRQVGKYVVNINLSDIASMGAQPLGLLFSLGLPRDLDDDFIHELSEGINDAAREHEVPILGGDTKEHGEMVISGTALGRVSKD